jgi:D-alanyl-D-alanine carboxypeptidase (penicillin-binding protein 5/6)
MISSRAASMGGSQVFLEEGEQITVEELIKCTVIASANDASVALAELTCGSEEAFVAKMNEKAKELELKNTYFENTTGLDDTTTDHHSCAYDIAVLSRELIKYELILKYSSIWQDSIRNGEMVLTNTNRLIRYYDGCNGLKTGSTDKAGFCITTTAKRGNLELIAVILGAETKDERNAAARALLDFGFANFALFEAKDTYLENIPVLKGKKDTTGLYSDEFVTVVNKGMLSSVERIFDIPENINAPIKTGDVIGSVTYKIGDRMLGKSDIYVKEDIGEINLFEVIIRILSKIVVGK